MGGQMLRTPTRAISRHQGGAFLILSVFFMKRPWGDLQAMGPNRQVRTQQVRPSGDAKMLRYGSCCGVMCGI